MLWLAIMDMIALISMSILYDKKTIIKCKIEMISAGVSLVIGEVFCSNPLLNLINGSLALGQGCYAIGVLPMHNIQSCCVPQ